MLILTAVPQRLCERTEWRLFIETKPSIRADFVHVGDTESSRPSASFRNQTTRQRGRLVGGEVPDSTPKSSREHPGPHASTEVENAAESEEITESAKSSQTPYFNCLGVENTAQLATLQAKCLQKVTQVKAKQRERSCRVYPERRDRGLNLRKAILGATRTPKEELVKEPMRPPTRVRRNSASDRIRQILPVARSRRRAFWLIATDIATIMSRLYDSPNNRDCSVDMSDASNVSASISSSLIVAITGCVFHLDGLASNGGTSRHP